MSLVKKQMVVLLCFLLFVAFLVYANKYVAQLQGPLSPAHAKAFAEYKKNFAPLMGLPGVQAGENNIKLTVTKSKGAFGLGVIASFQDPGKYLTIPSQYSKPMRVQKEGYWVEFTPAFSRPINNVTAEVLKSTIIYPNILQDVDIVQHVMPYGIKEDIVIKGKEAPTFYQWKMAMDPRLTARLEHNYVSFYKKGSSLPKETESTTAGTNFNETKMFEIAPPFLMDTKGNKYFQAYTALNNNIYTLSIEKKWLEKLNSYPLVLDPTILHNSSANFATGTHNRSWDEGSGAAPLLTTNYHELVADINTVGLWHMNEASGNVADGSGNGNTGTPTGTTVVAGILGNGRSFNGTSEYISVADNDRFAYGTGSFTIELWVKIANVSALSGNGAHFYSQYQDASNRIIALFTPTVIDFDQMSGGAWNITASVNHKLRNNTWHHIAIVRNGTEFRFYQDGEQLGSSIFDSDSVNNLSAALEIGKVGAFADRYFPGTLDEVRISNIARTPEEIKQDAQRLPYSVFTSPVMDLTQVASWTDLTWLAKGVRTGDGEVPVSTSSLVAQWNFNETSGTSAVSGGSCGTTCNGTLTNFASTTSQDQAIGTGWTANNKRWGAGALMFDGSNDAVSCADVSCGGSTKLEPTTLSVSSWINTSSLGAYQTIVGKGDFGTGNSRSYSLRINNSNKPEFLIYYSPGGSGNYCIATGTTTISAGAWYNLTGTHDGSNIKIYVNGLLETTTACVQSVFDSNSKFEIGGIQDTTDPNQVFKGTIDVVQIYSRALTASEILANYQAGNIEFQTRTSADNSTWEPWMPTSPASGVDVQIASMDSDNSNWIPDYGNSYTKLLLHADGANGSTAFLDSSINPRSMTVNNSTISTTQSKFGGTSASFTGSGSYLSTPGTSDFNFGTGDFTIDFWAYPTSRTCATYNAMMDQGSSTFYFNAGTACGDGGGTFHYYNYNLAFALTDTGNQLPLNTWTHVALVRSGNTWTLYKNGTSVASTTNSGSFGNFAGNLNVGGDPGLGYFAGYMDEVRISKGIARWTSNFTPPTSAYSPTTDASENLIWWTSKNTDSTTKFEGSGSEELTIGAPQVDSATVALWHMDETSGSGAYIKDATANANNGTPTGTTVVDGFYGKGRSFNGSSDFISASDTTFPSGSSARTIEAWIKTSMATEGYFFTYGTCSGTNTVGFGTLNGKLMFTQAGANIQSTANINNGKWRHVAMTQTGSTQKMYIDGIQDGNGSMTVNTVLNTTNIGRSICASGYFNGQVDEIKVSNVVKSDDEIAEAYRAGRDHRISKTITSTNLSSATKLPFYVASDRPGTFLEATIGESAYANYEPDANTVGLWHLEEQSGSGAYLKDSSGNGNNFSIAGGAPTLVQGKIGKARNFNGSSDYLSAPDSSNWFFSTGDFTIDVWASWNDVNKYLMIAQGKTIDGGTPPSAWALDIVSGGVNFFKNNVTQILNAPFSHSANTWYNFAITRAGNTLSAYVNGTFIKSVDITGTTFVDSGDPLTVGVVYCCAGNGTGVPVYFNGIMDELRISKGVARTPDEIRQAYEYGRRTHPITIDFVTSPQAAYASGTTVTINNPYGTTALTSTLAVGDTIIFKENVGGTETVSQATVTSVTNTSTTYGTVVVASAPTFPSGGFSTNAKVFKWQREYMDLTGSLTTQRDAITRITLRVTDGSQGANVWLDDFRSNTGYMTGFTPTSFDTATGIGTYTNTGITSTLNRYFQYRAINSSWDTAVAPSLTSVALNYVSNTSPGTPTISAPSNGATSVAIAPVITLSATDGQSDYLRYKIQIATDNAFTVGLQTFDQTVSQTGWSGQNAQTSTAYNSGSTATYTVQANLVYNQLYYIRAYSIDPGGSNTWSSPSTTGSFTTIPLPAPTNCQISATVVTGPAIVTWTDNLNIEDNYYIESSLNGGAWSAPTTLAANTITSSQTVATGTYQFRVRASAGGVYTSYCTTSSVVFPLQSMRFEGVRMEGVRIR